MLTRDTDKDHEAAHRFENADEMRSELLFVTCARCLLLVSLSRGLDILALRLKLFAMSIAPSIGVLKPILKSESIITIINLK